MNGQRALSLSALLTAAKTFAFHVHYYVIQYNKRSSNITFRVVNVDYIVKIYLNLVGFIRLRNVIYDFR